MSHQFAPPRTAPKLRRTKTESADTGAYFVRAKSSAFVTEWKKRLGGTNNETDVRVVSALRISRCRAPGGSRLAAPLPPMPGRIHPGRSDTGQETVGTPCGQTQRSVVTASGRPSAAAIHSLKDTV